MTSSALLQGRRLALVVVDVQEGAVARRPFEIDRVLHNIRTLVSAARDSGTQMVFVQHDGEPGEPEEPHTPGWFIHSSIAPQAGESVFRKRSSSAFRGTQLHTHLKDRAIDTLIIVGIQTEYCVDTTVRVAFELGYLVVLPEMTNTTFDNGPIAAHHIYEMFNRRIFDGRFASVVPVEEVLHHLA